MIPESMGFKFITGNNFSILINTESEEESTRLLNKLSAGGNVIGEPVMIPGVGTYVSFKDTEGNVLSILKPLMA